MGSLIFRIFAFLSLVMFALVRADMGSAITVDEDMLDSAAKIAIATTAMDDLGPLTIETAPSQTTEALEIVASEGSEPTNAPKDKEGDEVETYTNANSTMTTATREEETATTTTKDIEAPATRVPDLLASGVSFRDPGFIALTVLSGLMLFMMVFV